MDKRFDLIVANYPFSIKWEPDKEDVRFKDWVDVPPPSKADYAFIMHMMYLLADDGICVSLNFPGILYRKAREGRIRKELVERGYVKEVIQVPSGYFEDTNIETVILVLSKEEFKGSIKFVNLAEDLERDVPVDEIAENDYILSVSTYVQKEIEVEEIDEEELRESVRGRFIDYVDSVLGVEFFLAVEFGDEKAKVVLLEFYKKVLDVVEKHIVNLKGQEKSPGTDQSTRT